MAAIAGARKIAGALGMGWSGEVWENLGWHYKAINLRAGLEVYPSGRVYWATTTDAQPQHDAHARTPRAAVRKLVNAVTLQAGRLQWALLTTPL